MPTTSFTCSEQNAPTSLSRQCEARGGLRGADSAPAINHRQHGRTVLRIRARAFLALQIFQLQLHDRVASSSAFPVSSTTSSATSTEERSGGLGLRASRRPAGRTASANVLPHLEFTLDLSKSLGESTSNFVCATLDWWPREQNDDGRFPWQFNTTIPWLDAKKLVPFVRGMQHERPAPAGGQAPRPREPRAPDGRDARAENGSRGASNAGSYVPSTTVEPPSRERELSSTINHPPVILRVGGSCGDLIIYEERLDEDEKAVQSWNHFRETHGTYLPKSSFEPHPKPEPCPDFEPNPDNPPLYYTNGCLKREKLKNLLEFCEQANCKIIFGLNGLFGEKLVPLPNKNPKIPDYKYFGRWNPRNAFYLLWFVKFVLRKSHVILGFELGNELGGIPGVPVKFSVEHYAAAYRILEKLVSWFNDNDETALDWSGSSSSKAASKLLDGRGDRALSSTSWKVSDEQPPRQEDYDVAENIKPRPHDGASSSTAKNTSSKNTPAVKTTKTAWQLFGVASWFDYEWLRRFQELLKFPHFTFTTHLYSLGSGPGQTRKALIEGKILNATYLDEMHTVARSNKQLLHHFREDYGPTKDKNLKIMLGESGGAFGSGATNITDGFYSGFWFLDQLAIFAIHGENVHYCRQTLVGAFYELVSGEFLVPNPDWYVSSLWNYFIREGGEFLEIKESAGVYLPQVLANGEKYDPLRFADGEINGWSYSVEGSTAGAGRTTKATTSKNIRMYAHRREADASTSTAAGNHVAREGQTLRGDMVTVIFLNLGNEPVRVSLASSGMFGLPDPGSADKNSFSLVKTREWVFEDVESTTFTAEQHDEKPKRPKPKVLINGKPVIWRPEFENARIWIEEYGKKFPAAVSTSNGDDVATARTVAPQLLATASSSEDASILPPRSYGFLEFNLATADGMEKRAGTAGMMTQKPPLQKNTQQDDQNEQVSDADTFYA
ncbi:unnamed protein product [Amoebophrya sp. A120]|nr:unnamed protein product [Amoebophrya sp. A120]|eukprot:GSA120T00017263001.1